MTPFSASSAPRAPAAAARGGGVAGRPPASDSAGDAERRGDPGFEPLAERGSDAPTIGGGRGGGGGGAWSTPGPAAEAGTPSSVLRRAGAGGWGKSGVSRPGLATVRGSLRLAVEGAWLRSEVRSA